MQDEDLAARTEKETKKFATLVLPTPGAPTQMLDTVLFENITRLQEAEKKAAELLAELSIHDNDGGEQKKEEKEKQEQDQEQGKT